MKKHQVTALLLTTVLAAGLVSACQQDTDTSGQGQSSEVSSQQQISRSPREIPQISQEEPSDITGLESKPELTASQLNEINTYIDQYRDIPVFRIDSENISAKEITKGKSVSLICDSFSDTFTSLLASQFKDAAKSAGFSAVAAEKSDGTPAFYNSALEKAVDSSQIVVMFGDIDKSVLVTSIEQAQAHGIRVLSAGNVGETVKDQCVDYTIPIEYALPGRLLADWAVSQTKGKVNALAVNNSDSMVSTAVYKGFAEEFKKQASSGYCTVLSGTQVEFGNGLSVKIREALEKDPNLQYIVVLDSDMIPDAIEAAAQVGRKDLKIISTGGSIAALEAVENNQIDMLVAQSYEWTAYAMVDYTVRVLGKKTLPDVIEVPVRVLTPDSLKAAKAEGSFSGMKGFYEICFGSNFVTGYSFLWSA